jgi:2-succinyl-5-enolpyruvyl-6-hydroxy-3-cyclohexene-1-carboxylate synthase
MTAKDPQSLAASSLMASLAASGVRHVVCSPGSRSTPLVLAAADCPGIELLSVLDERSAGFVALGLCRATGAPTALLCSSGSAGAHYLPAIIEASESALPLIILTADRPPELQNTGSWQTIRQSHMFGSHVRWFEDTGVCDRPELAARSAQVGARAAQRSRARPAGPVHLNLPFREPLWTGDGSAERPRPAARVLDEGASAPTDALVERVARLLGKAERGLFVCGPLPPRSTRALATSVSTLARQLGWPVIAEPASGLRFGNHDRSQLVTHADLLLRSPAFADALEPDLIVRIGQSPCSKPTLTWLATRESAESLLIDPDGLWRDPSQSARTLIAEDPDLLLRAITARLEGETRDPAWLDAWMSAEATARALLEKPLTDPEILWEGAIAAELSRSLPQSAALHIANSMPIRDFDAFGGARAEALDCYVSRGVNGIDGTIATAVGEALGSGAERFWLVTGELAFLHDLGSLRLLRQLAIPVTMVVIDNGGGGIFEHLPIARHPRHFEPLFLTPQGEDIGALAKAHGLRSLRVERLEELRAALRAPSGSEPLIIEARIDREANLEEHRAVWRAISDQLERQASSQALSREGLHD